MLWSLRSTLLTYLRLSGGWQGGAQVPCGPWRDSQILGSGWQNRQLDYSGVHTMNDVPVFNGDSQKGRADA